MKKYGALIFGCFSLLVLIFDSAAALNAAKEAIAQCIYMVVPSLLPFFSVSILLTGLMGEYNFRFLAPLGRAMRIPEGSEGLYLLGLLGGYPAGAQAVAHCYGQGQLSLKDARRMLPFCSNAGPGFLFGIAAQALGGVKDGFLLWGVLIASSLLTGMCLPGGNRDPVTIRRKRPVSPTVAVASATKITAVVCSWIILMRIILSFCQRWFLWLLNKPAQVFVSGVLELATGCMALPMVENEGMRFVLGCVMLSFGGICVAMQTAALTASTGLGLYLPGKLLQSLFAAAIGCAIKGYGIVSAVFAVLIVFFLLLTRQKTKKTVAIPDALLYND